MTHSAAPMAEQTTVTLKNRLSEIARGRLLVLFQVYATQDDAVAGVH